MIQLRDFSYRYPGSEEQSLTELSFELTPGQFCGVVGANGAGKSTLCFALSGFVPHYFRGQVQGELIVNGQNVATSSLGELAGQVGLVFQNPFNQISGARFSVREEIAFGLENLAWPRPRIVEAVDKVLADFDLRELAERSPFELSGGQQQRVAIASVLAMQPKVLVLDEPTSQLDPQSTEGVFRTLDLIAKRGDTIVVLAEHKLELIAAFADRVLVLDKGKLLMDGTPGQVLTSPVLADLGVGRTLYTEAAAAVSSKASELPVTLEQGQAFFA